MVIGAAKILLNRKIRDPEKQNDCSLVFHLKVKEWNVIYYFVESMFFYGKLI